MKKQIVFIAILQICFSICSFAQIDSTLILARKEKELIIKGEFDDYLKLILPQPNDSILEIDSSNIYKIHFITTHSFNRAWEIYDSCYVDSEKLICTQNIIKSTDSIQLNFIDFNVVDSGLTKINDNSRLNLTFHTYKKHPSERILMGAYSTLVSIKNGKYLIISERRFGPDIRGNMPPGYDITYFIELIE